MSESPRAVAVKIKMPTERAARDSPIHEQGCLGPHDQVAVSGYPGRVPHQELRDSDVAASLNFSALSIEPLKCGIANDCQGASRDGKRLLAIDALNRGIRASVDYRDVFGHIDDDIIVWLWNPIGIPVGGAAPEIVAGAAVPCSGNPTR